jgi:hypothetical protein
MTVSLTLVIDKGRLTGFNEEKSAVQAKTKDYFLEEHG